MPFRQPGRTLPNGHVVRSNMEAALCDYLHGAREPHAHATLNFTLPIGARGQALFTPSIVLTRTRQHGRILLIEPVSSTAPGGGLRRLAAFRAEHAAEYCLVVVARRTLHTRIPEDTYDLLVPLEEFSRLDEFLRHPG